jgi:DEAD/DEAH box helicase domain-containing protein
LCGLDGAEVSSDGSPAAPRVFALVNPPVVDAATGVRTSANSETAAIMTDLVRAGHRTIAFCRSRKGTELVAGDVRRRLGPAMGEKVRPYRGGYLAEERREIEAALFGGELLGVVATTALELGVDIGGLDACILDGFPGTIASMWQQAGRAGRSGRHSLAVLVAGEDQLDLWLMTHPTEVFHRPPEPAVINPSNPFVLGPHLACAAFERPLTHDDRRLWGDDLDDGVRELVQADQLRIRPPRRRGAGPSAVWAGRGVPAPRVGLRSGGGGEYRIAQADGTLVGTVDESRVHGLVHPGAVYLHQGRSWRVTELDIGLRRATVETDPGEEYTQARSDTSVRVLRVDDRRRVGRSDLFLGRLEVRSQVTGYQRREVRTRRVLGNEVLDLPPTTLRTTAFWYVLDDEVLDEAGLLAPVGVDPDAPFAGAGDAIGSALHAIEHASIGMLPLFTICDRWDVGGLSIATHPDTGGATFFIYDGYPGGTGISALGFDAADRHLDAAREVIRTCGCASGCPSCIQSPKCGNANEFLDKAGGLATLDALLGPVAGAPGVTTPAAGSTSR